MELFKIIEVNGHPLQIIACGTALAEPCDQYPDRGKSLSNIIHYDYVLNA
jgi:hypothetical protein